MSMHTHQHPDYEGHEHDHDHQGGVRGFIGGLLNLHSHDHSDLAAESAFANNEVGIRTVLAAAGSWLGFPLAVPIIGLLIGVAILFITWDASKRIWYRLMDAVEPEIVQRVETAVLGSPLVLSVERLRLRWIGHELQGDIRLSLRRGAETAVAKDEIRHAARHAAPKLTDLAIDLVNSQEPICISQQPIEVSSPEIG